MKGSVLSVEEVPIRSALLSEVVTVKSAGLVLNDHTRHQPDIDKEIHLLTVLVDGQRKTFWRPIIGEYLGIKDSGFWEDVSTNRSYIIRLLE
jgi:hypothetical protein